MFDPETLEYRNNPSEENESSGTSLGSITKDIVLDIDVDPELFKLAIPDGFVIAKDPQAPVPVVEDELIEWLRITARVNDGTFHKGVKLGSSNTIILWYQLKTIGQFRAVHGDSTVHHISSDDLPIPLK